MDTQKLIKRLRLAIKNPDLGIGFSNEELTLLTAALLNTIDQTNAAIEAGKLKGEDGFTPKAGSDYLTPAQQKEIITALFTDAAQKHTAQLENAVSKLQNGKDGKDGKDAQITDEQIAEAATRAYEMITLPDFDSLITQEPEAVRNALDLLEGDDRYQVQIDDVKELRERLEALEKRPIGEGRGGGTSKPAVVRFVNEAIAAGEINVGSAVTFQEEDGSPTGTFDTIKVTNGTLTDNGDGSASLNIPPPGGGEANTASNVGTAGVGVFKQKTTVDLEFKNINAGSASVTVTDDTGNDEIDIDLSTAAKASLALADSALQNVVEDTTPQLGGDLDLNGNDITDSGAAARSILKSGTGALNIESAGGGLNLRTVSGNGEVNITAHGTGDIKFNTDDLIIDTSTSRLGIRESAPEGPLHINAEEVSTGLYRSLFLESATDDNFWSAIAIKAGTTATQRRYFEFLDHTGTRTNFLGFNAVNSFIVFDATNLIHYMSADQGGSTRICASGTTGGIIIGQDTNQTGNGGLSVYDGSPGASHPTNTYGRISSVGVQAYNGRYVEAFATNNSSYTRLFTTSKSYLRGSLGLELSSATNSIVFSNSSYSDQVTFDMANTRVGIGVTSPDTTLDVNGAITARELSADPANPDEGAHVIWQSDGTGSGDDGDIMCKITAGGVTKTVTLVDFSVA